MKRPPTRRLGDLQLRILKVLWELGDASVSDVHERLGKDPRLAYTTVATMLRKMEDRSLVRHRVEERRFIYRAAVKEEDVARNMVDHVVERLFAGNLAGMVSHLLATREISREELKDLEELIVKAKRATRRSP